MNPRRVSPLPWREIDECAVILSPSQGTIHEMNEVGTFLWKLADGSRSYAELATTLCDAFEVSREDAERDVGAFFTNLSHLGLLAEPRAE